MIDEPLTSEELERLAVLSEELGEAQQAVAKIIRFGYRNGRYDNGTNLTNELGDVAFALWMMIKFRDVTQVGIEERMHVKASKIDAFLHHQKRKLYELWWDGGGKFLHRD